VLTDGRGFTELRPHLVRVGYRITGSVADDRGEPCALVADLRPRRIVERGQAQPRLLHGVLGVGHAAGDPVADPDEMCPVLGEHPLVRQHDLDATPWRPRSPVPGATA
jgi:hypothetical protein